MNWKYILSFTFLSLLILSAEKTEAQVVGKAENGPFLLKNAEIHTISGGIIQGDLLIENGKIKAIGGQISAPAGAETIDCSGKKIYPGMIDSGTQLGTAEVNSISLTIDHNEVGNLNPHMDVLTAVNPNATAIPVTRVSGVTTVLTSPTSGLFSGKAALIDLFGYNPGQMFAGFKGEILNFPSKSRRGGRFFRQSEEEVKKAYEKAIKDLDQIWEAAYTYYKLDSAATAAGKKYYDHYQPEMKALSEVVAGKVALIIEVNRKEDILEAIKWLMKRPQVKGILSGVSEGFKVAEDIAKSKYPVLVGPILALPGREYDAYDVAYTNAAELQKAGVKIAIRTAESENVRNLPFHAGFAAAYGLGTDEAFKAVSLYPAQIFGVDKDYGSLEAGKTGNLFICDGDPFEPSTKIEQVFIKGWKVPMNSRHTLLYDEFLERAPGVK